MADEAAPAETASEAMPSMSEIIAAVEAEVGGSEDSPAPAGDTPAAPAEPAEAPAEPAAPAQAPPAETPPAEPAAADEPSDERVRLALRGAAKREAKALAKEREAAQALERARTATELIEALRGPSPLAALTRLLGADQVAPMLERITNEGTALSPQDALAQKLDSLEQLVRNDQRARENAHQQAVIAQAQREVADKVKAAGETFDLINSTGQHDMVWSTMMAIYERDGEAPDPMEVAAAVEKHLEEQILTKAATSKKFQARVGAPKPTPTSGDKAAPKPSPGAVTLDNRDTPAVPSSDEDELPADPRARERALLRTFA